MRALRAAVLLGLVIAAPAARADDDARLRQAETLAHKQEAEAAVQLYRELLAEGRDGKDLRYNLGTLCLELADIGCAVLHLRTAAFMDPRDDDVRHNLGVAIEARADRLAGSAVVNPFESLGARVPPRLARLALAVPLAALGLALVLLAAVQWRRGGALRSPLQGWARGLTLFAAASSAPGAAVYAARLLLEGTSEAIIVVPESEALKEPDPAATVAFTAHAGLHGDVVGRSPGLVRLRFENGLEAWIKESDAALVR